MGLRQPTPPTSSSTADSSKAADKLAEATDLAVELEAEAKKIPVSPRLVADDVTAESLVTLLAGQGGRLAVMSPEGGVFELMAGRGNVKNSAPNFDVYLKGHAGDQIRVDRVGRPPEFVRDPALTLGLAVQPAVIRGLAAKPGFRGKGLLARFFWSLPRSLVGRRAISPPGVPSDVRIAYESTIAWLLRAPTETDEHGELVARILGLDEDALATFTDFQAWLEPRLAPETGELGTLADWGGKLAGAVARIAAILHVSTHASSDPAAVEISRSTIESAIKIGHYLAAHAEAAFIEMGTDKLTEDARAVVDRLPSFGSTLTKREIHQALRARFAKSKDLDAVLELLVEHDYLRPLPSPAGRPGRPSEAFAVNPAARCQTQV